MKNVKMDRIQPKERKFLRKFFFNLKQMDALNTIISSSVGNPQVELVIRGGLSEDCIYGIIVELYEVSF